MTNAIVAGDVATFTYRGSRDMYPELHKRTGSRVTVRYMIGGLSSEVEPLYRVRFGDGYEHDAYASELQARLHDGTGLLG